MFVGLWRFGTVRPDWSWAGFGNDISFGPVFLFATLYLAAAVPFILWSLIYRLRGLATIGLAVTWAVILASSSRSGLLGLLAGSFLTTAALRKRILVMVQLTVVFILLTFAAASPESVRQLFATSGDRFESIASTARFLFSGEMDQKVREDNERLVMYEAGAQAIRERWARGIGYDNFELYCLDTTGVQVVSHSIIITLLGECGLAGFTIFSLFTLDCFRSCRNRWRTVSNQEEKALALASGMSLLTVLFLGAFHPMLRNALIFMQLGFCAGLSERSQFGNADK
jgi:O-antigen ligase